MNVIKESFDNLPIAVCFFDRNGLVRLVNRRMLEISAVLLGTEFQTLFELRYALLAPPNKEISVIDKSFPVLRFPDGKSLRFEETEITVNSREKYTQVTAADVAKLALRQGELKEENKRLADANRRVKRLYDNMAEIVREEEILSMKMRVHDDIGHSILSARKALLKNESIDTIKDNAATWEKSIELLYHSNNMPNDSDDIEYAKERAAALGVQVFENGNPPESTALRRLFALAIRESVTNCVRHAGGTKLYVMFKKSGGFFTAKITNNGKAPQEEIVEGGGLSALRKRIEKSGGKMIVQSFPVFELSVLLPIRGEKND